MTKKQKKSSRQRIKNKRSMKYYFNNISTAHLSNTTSAQPVVASKSAGYSASIKRASGRGA